MNRFEQMSALYASLDADTRRLIMILIAIALLFILGYSTLLNHLTQLGKVRNSREQILKELLVLRQQHKEAAADAERLTNRLASVAANDSPASVIEQSGIVLKGGIQSKPLPRQDRGLLVEEGAEVTLTGLSLNETVNLVYRLEQGTKPLAIRRAVLRSRFNDPAKLDLTLQVALFRAGSQVKP